MRQGLFGRYDAGLRISASSIGSKLAKAALIGLPLIIGGATTQAQTLASLPHPSRILERDGGAKPVTAMDPGSSSGKR